jgi:hypothetical protein
MWHRTSVPERTASRTCSLANGPTSQPAPVPPTATSPTTVGRRPDPLVLRADGIGTVDFGATTTDAASEVRLALQDTPLTDGPTEIVDQCVAPGVDPSWRSSLVLSWPSVSLAFAGPDADSLHLTGWRATGTAQDGDRLGLAGGPFVGDDLATWQAAYGSRLELLPTSGTEDPPVIVNFAVHLPDGDIRVPTRQQDGAAIQTVIAGASCDPAGA